jgi:Ca-activated chloride channel family protein
MSIRADVRDATGGPAPITWVRLAMDFGSLLARAFFLAAAVGLLLTAAAVALPAPVREGEQALAPERMPSGSFLMRRAKGEPWAQAPTLATEVSFRVAGVVARASVRQRFRNASGAWVEGVYVFPLPETAAVDHLLMRVGERTIEGQIREREQAKAEYQQARDEGRKASLVEQERPNIFTTSVANLGPGEELVVEIEFQQTLRFDEGEVRLRFPLVVGPRYIPGQQVLEGIQGLGWSPDTSAVPDASRITPPVLPPGEAPRNPVAIEVELDAGFPVQALESRYHAIVSEERGEGRYAVRLRDELVPADRDFELAWTPRPGTMPRGALFREERGGATYALVTLFPPVGPAVEAARLQREIAFVIDTSGSMQGLSIQQARNALVLAIERLRPGDRFNVIQFNSTTEVLWDEARSATSGNREAARSWVEGLRANGGTEMAGALEAALVGSDDPGLVRQVVFLTDGSVGNEDQLFGIIRQRLGDTRLFTVGIGSAPNGHFMTKAAEFGHGSFTYIGDVREVEEKMARLFTVLESPVLTGIEMSWPQGAAVEAWPSRIPDLYLGEPVVVSVRLSGPADQVAVSGRRGSEAWTTAMAVAGGRRGQGASVLWARRKIESLLDSLHEGTDPAEVRKGVVALGLEHHLVTKHTSLVAVDVTPSRPGDAELRSGALATNLPHGWSYEGVFGELPQTATAAPLHALLAVLALLAAAVLRMADRSWRAGDRS